MRRTTQYTAGSASCHVKQDTQYTIWREPTYKKRWGGYHSEPTIPANPFFCLSPTHARLDWPFRSLDSCEQARGGADCLNLYLFCSILFSCTVGTLAPQFKARTVSLCCDKLEGTAALTSPASALYGRARKESGIVNCDETEVVFRRSLKFQATYFVSFFPLIVFCSVNK